MENYLRKIFCLSSCALDHAADKFLAILDLGRLGYANRKACEWSGYSQEGRMVLEGILNAEH